MEPVKHFWAYCLVFILLLVIFSAAGFLARPLPGTASKSQISVQTRWQSLGFGMGDVYMLVMPAGGGPCIKAFGYRVLRIGPVTIARYPL